MLEIKTRQRIAVTLGLLLALGAPAVMATAEDKTIEPTKIGSASPKVQLSVEKLNAIIKAEDNLSELAQNDSSLKQLLSTKPQDKKAANEWIRKVEGQPKVVEAFRRAGLTPREYLVTAGALLRAASLSDQKRRHQGISKELADMVPPEHLAFVEANRDIVDNWQTRSQKVSNKVNTLEDLYAAPVETAPAAAASKPAAQKPQASSKP